MVFQFSLATILISATLTVQNQLTFMQEKKLGFDKEGIVELDIFWKSRDIDGPNQLRNRYLDVKQAFTSHPGILAASGARFPQDRVAPLALFEAEGHSERFRFGNFGVDESYVGLFGLEIVAGRGLIAEDRANGSFGSSYLLNERAVDLLGWKDPIGKRFGGGVVVGVVKDFHLGSLHNEIGPLAFKHSTMKFLYLKIAPHNVRESIAHVEKTWNRLLPSRPFTYSFLDEQLDRANYANEIRLARVFSLFSGLAIAVACLGLLGVVSFSAERRVREIGIRRVLGATERTLLRLFLKEFVVMVAVANVVVLPLAYWGTGEWLSHFAYRVSQDLPQFLLSGILTGLLATTTVSILALRAARRDPAEALRYE